MILTVKKQEDNSLPNTEAPVTDPITPEHSEKACCFTGHRTVPTEKLAEIRKKLAFELEWLTSHGVTDFYAGGALGFDTLAELCVLDLKKRLPAVRLHLALPCPEQEKYWKPNEIETYRYLLTEADSVVYMSDHYHKGTMHMRNQYMVDHSAYCLCYYDEESVEKGENSGKGTLSTVNYARKKHIRLINLCDCPPDDGQLEFEF